MQMKSQPHNHTKIAFTHRHKQVGYSRADRVSWLLMILTNISANHLEGLLHVVTFLQRTEGKSVKYSSNCPLSNHCNKTERRFSEVRELRQC